MIICFGEMLLRLSPPGCERLFQSPTLTTIFGGSEANVATSLARFGIDAAYVTRLPKNAIGEAALRTLRAEGVRTDHVQRADGRMGIYFVETGAGQRPSTVIYDRAPSTMTAVDEQSFNWPRILSNASWLHVSGITAALGDGPAACTLAAMTAAKRAGVTVSFDVNYRATLWPVEQAAPVLRQLAGGADVLIAHEDHFEPLLSVSIARPPAERDAACYREAAQAAHAKYGATTVAITQRDHRSASDNVFSARLWDGRTDDLHAAPAHDVRIVDRVGTGDAFAAGLIYGLSTGRDPGNALRFAVAAGALKHTIPGDSNRVSLEEVERLANGDGSGRVQR
jgi:2-dehydro-3-deoxygluconokinase